MYECLPFLHICMCTMCGLVLVETTRHSILELELTDGYELPCVYWELNLSLLQEEQVLLKH